MQEKIHELNITHLANGVNKNLKTKKPIENKDEQEKKEKVEEKPLKSAEEEKKSEKKDTGLKAMFSWLK